MPLIGESISRYRPTDNLSSSDLKERLTIICMRVLCKLEEEGALLGGKRCWRTDLVIDIDAKRKEMGLPIFESKVLANIEVDNVSFQCPQCGVNLGLDSLLSCPYCSSQIYYEVAGQIDRAGSLQRQIYLLQLHLQIVEDRVEQKIGEKIDSLRLSELQNEVFYKKEELAKYLIFTESQNNTKARSCPNCGAPLKDPFYCDHCGSAVVFSQRNFHDFCSMNEKDLQSLYFEQKEIFLSALRVYSVLGHSIGFLINPKFTIDSSKAAEMVATRHQIINGMALLTNIRAAMPAHQVRESKLQLVKKVYPNMSKQFLITGDEIAVRCLKCGGQATISAGKHKTMVDHLLTCQYCGSAYDLGLTKEDKKEVYRLHYSALHQQINLIAQYLTAVKGNLLGFKDLTGKCSLSDFKLYCSKNAPNMKKTILTAEAYLDLLTNQGLVSEINAVLADEADVAGVQYEPISFDRELLAFYSQ